MGWVLAVADIDRLLDLWQSGVSASRIAGLLGVTKGVVSGHIFRARAKGDMRADRRAPKPKAVKVTRKALEPARVEVPPPVEPVPLIDCRPGCCRWPVAEDQRGHLFCDRPVEFGQRPQWCAEHRAIGFARAA